MTEEIDLLVQKNINRAMMGQLLIMLGTEKVYFIRSMKKATLYTG